MSNAPLTREQAEAAWKIVKQYGAIATAAKAAGVSKTTMEGHYNAALYRFGFERVHRRKGQKIKADPPPPEAVAPQPEKTPREVHDLAYWKAEAKRLKAEVGKLDHALGEVSGVMGRPVEQLQWMVPKSEPEGRAVGLLCISDIHAGEVISPDQIRNLNAYDLDICKARLRRLFAAALNILPRWASDCKMQGVVVSLNGDLISGDIHDELRRSNALTSPEQVWFVVDEIAAGIDKLAAEFGLVFVPCTPGNHGRITEKPHSKNYAKLSYDTMVAEALARHFRDDKRVTISISASRDIVFPVFGWSIFQSHGDALGTGGGRGFIGPLAPIVRGTKLVELQAYDAGERYAVIITGHNHTSANPGRGKLANGSVPGVSEYGQGPLRGSLEPPQQWLALITDRWGLRERCEIQLEDPTPRERPRIRVPAGISRA